MEQERTRPPYATRQEKPPMSQAHYEYVMHVTIRTDNFDGDDSIENAAFILNSLIDPTGSNGIHVRPLSEVIAA